MASLRFRISDFQFKASIDRLLNEEKQMRLAKNVAGTRKAATEILKLCFEAKDWKLLNEQILNLSKKRGQLKQAVQSMVQQAMQYIDETPDIETRIELIKTLKNVSGKVTESKRLCDCSCCLSFCESLVSLSLNYVTLGKPEFISLPSLKVMDLHYVEFDDDEAAFEMLISGCPVLESLTLCWRFFCNVKVLRVRSKSLVSFTNVIGEHEEDDDVNNKDLVIDAPRLKYLKLFGHENVMNSLLPSLEYVDIERPLSGDAMEMKLVRYFLEKSIILKKLTIRLDSRNRDAFDIHKELHAIPRISPSCQVILLRSS